MNRSGGVDACDQFGWGRIRWIGPINRLAHPKVCASSEFSLALHLALLAFEAPALVQPRTSDGSAPATNPQHPPTANHASHGLLVNQATRCDQPSFCLPHCWNRGVCLARRGMAWTERWWSASAARTQRPPTGTAPITSSLLASGHCDHCSVLNVLLSRALCQAPRA